MPTSEVPAGMLERVVAGDAEAFEVVMTVYRPKLLRYAVQLLRDNHSAEDVVQETLLRFWHKASQIEGDQHVSAWLFKVTKNIIVDERRSMRSRREVVLNPADLHGVIAKHMPGTLDNYPHLDPLLEARVMMNHVMKHLGSTSRFVLLMRAEGYEYKRIAQRMHIPTGTVKSRLSFAKRRAYQIAKRLGWQATA